MTVLPAQIWVQGPTASCPLSSDRPFCPSEHQIFLSNEDLGNFLGFPIPGLGPGNVELSPFAYVWEPGAGSRSPTEEHRAGPVEPSQDTFVSFIKLRHLREGQGFLIRGCLHFLISA